MTPITPKQAYWQGFRAASPFLLVVLPFGGVFGVVATEAGLNLAQVMGFSVLVIAGAAQLAAVQLMTENAPVLIVLAAALAVNLRMAMYSASLVPHLGATPFWMRGIMAYFLFDQPYAASIARFEQKPELSTAAKAAYYFGTFSPIAVPWYLATWAGAALGTAIPPGIPVDFAVPITFLAIIAPMLRTPAHVAAAFVSIVATLLLGALPYNTGLLIAAVAAMATGAQVELWASRRREK